MTIQRKRTVNGYTLTRSIVGWHLHLAITNYVIRRPASIGKEANLPRKGWAVFPLYEKLTGYARTLEEAVIACEANETQRIHAAIFGDLEEGDRKEN